MRHRKAGRKLGRTTAHRKAMLRNLVVSLFLTAEDDEEGQPWRVTTTVPKAKEARRLAERCITLAKRALRDPDQALHAKRQAIRLLQDKHAVRVLFENIAPLYNDRQGGYTRVMRLASRRLGDGSDLCFLELVTEPVAAPSARAEPVAPRRTVAPEPDQEPQAGEQPAREDQAPQDERAGADHEPPPPQEGADPQGGETTEPNDDKETPV